MIVLYPMFRFILSSILHPFINEDSYQNLVTKDDITENLSVFSRGRNNIEVRARPEINWNTDSNPIGGDMVTPTATIMYLYQLNQFIAANISLF